eukprot:1127557-Pelagomonas_calceolata.AAC.1
MGIWRISGSTRLQNLAVRSMIVFNSTSSGNRLVGVHNRMGMKLASKFNGTLMVKLFELIINYDKGVFNIPGPANAQKDSTKSFSFCTNEFAEVCMLLLCCLQLLSRPRVLTVLDFNQVHMSLASIQLVRLSHAVSFAGPLRAGCGVPCCVTHGVNREKKKKKKKMKWVWLDRGDLKVVLCQSVITPYVRVNQACSQRAFAKSFDDGSSSNIV